MILVGEFVTLNIMGLPLGLLNMLFRVYQGISDLAC